MTLLETVAGLKRKRRRSQARLSPTESAALLRFVARNARAGKLDARKLARIVGCSLRTAQRLLSGNARLVRRSYAVKLSAALGWPIESMLDVVDATLADRLTGWYGVTWNSDAHLAAANLACGVAAFALSPRYELPSDYFVSNSVVSGRPDYVIVTLKPLFGPRYRLMFTEDKLLRGMRMEVTRYGDPKGHIDTNVKLTLNTLKYLLSRISDDAKLARRHAAKRQSIPAAGR